MKRTPKEIAEAEGISLSTIYSLVRQGRLSAYRIGARGRGRYLIDDDDWRVFLESCREEAVRPEGDYKYL